MYRMFIQVQLNLFRFKSKEHRLLFEKYSKANDDERVILERRYGRKQLQQLTELMLSEDYLKDNAKTCPHCNAPIEKNEVRGQSCFLAWSKYSDYLRLCFHTVPVYNHRLFLITNLLSNDLTPGLQQGYLLEVQHTLLLAVRRQAASGEPVLAFQYPRGKLLRGPVPGMCDY